MILIGGGVFSDRFSCSLAQIQFKFWFKITSQYNCPSVNIERWQYYNKILQTLKAHRIFFNTVEQCSNYQKIKSMSAVGYLIHYLHKAALITVHSSIYRMYDFSRIDLALFLATYSPLPWYVLRSNVTCARLHKSVRLNVSKRQWRWWCFPLNCAACH